MALLEIHDLPNGPASVMNYAMLHQINPMRIRRILPKLGIEPMKPCDTFFFTPEDVAKLDAAFGVNSAAPPMAVVGLVAGPDTGVGV